MGGKLMKLHLQFNLKNKIKLTLFYISTITLGTIIYISLFSINLMKTNGIPLAKPLFLLVMVCITFFFFLIFLKERKVTPQPLIFKDIVLITVLLFFINYSLYGLIPFNSSRSNSIIMLGYLYKNKSSSKTKNEIETFVKEEYFDKYHAIQNRLNEQINAGNIKEKNGGYELTPQGITVVKVIGYITDLYKTDTNFTKL